MPQSSNLSFPYTDDPRFDFKVVDQSKRDQWLIKDPKGDQNYINPATAKPWVDIGLPTQLADMKSILQGRGGTSEGDAWAPSDIATVKALALKTGGVANEALVNAYKQFLLNARDPHFMSTHPGKAAYNTPAGGGPTQ